MKKKQKQKKLKSEKKKYEKRYKKVIIKCMFVYHVYNLHQKSAIIILNDAAH